MKQHLSALTIFALAISYSSHGGELSGSGKEPLAPGKAPLEECIELGGFVGITYLSDQFIHGMRLNRDTVAVTAGYRFESIVPLTIGVTQSMGISTIFPYTAVGPVDLTDVGIEAELGSFLGFDLSLGYLHRFIDFTGAPGDLSTDYGEVSLELRRDFGFVEFVASSTLGLQSRDSFFAAGGGDGWIHTAGLEKTIPLCESTSLHLSGGVAYHDGFFYAVPGTHDWSHYYLAASLPIALNCRTTLTPYIGYNGVQQWGVYFPQGDALHGGVNLQVSF
jgi:hypothetical protein